MGVPVDNEIFSYGMTKEAKPARWGIVLAAGHGERMRPFVESWLGEARPKQFCTFTGSRSMLQHTLDRALCLASPERLLTVIDEAHEAFFEEGVFPDCACRVIKQPLNRGTAASIFLAASHVLARDPSATLFILPSDHFIVPESRFIESASYACRLAEQFDDLILLGAVPSGPQTDYGWIQPSVKARGPTITNGLSRLLAVSSFHEKPAPELAEHLFANGGLWNTMIMAVKVSTLWVLGWRLLPEMMWKFESVVRLRQEAEQGRITEVEARVRLLEIYRDLPGADFSEDILNPVGGWTSVLPMENVYWADWGRPDRLVESIIQQGLTPQFPVELAEKAAATESDVSQKVVAQEAV